MGKSGIFFANLLFFAKFALFFPDSLNNCRNGFNSCPDI